MKFGDVTQSVIRGNTLKLWIFAARKKLSSPRRIALSDGTNNLFARDLPHCV
jgi:hypothetical protein